MRALLVANPTATGTTPRTREVLAAALGNEVKLDVAETGARGDATELARRAAEDGVDLVVALGGDGTVNEVVNGLLATGPSAAVPALGVVPGGCANVFARSIGLPVEPMEATAQLLEALRAGRSRSLGLGRADDRWFTFTAGLGIDAATVARVERRRRDRPVTPWQYVRAAVTEFYVGLDRSTPPLELVEADGTAHPVFIALVCNTRPWTYLGERPVVPCPDADFDSGLDAFGLTKAASLPTLRTLSHLLRDRAPRGRRVVSLHDQPTLELRAATPQAFQVDGDHLGEASSVRLTAVPHALRVYC